MRHDNRSYSDLREVTIETGVNPYAEGSCLIKCGNTHILCTASVDTKLPDWLKDADKGWVTAEYALLPRATLTRVSRDKALHSGRTQEIQRLIGRSLRSVIDLEALKGYQILIDCDVLQADGGTRTASVTGAFVALYIAFEKMLSEGLIEKMPIKEFVAAVSCGIKDGKILLDLDYEEDSSTDTDSNFVLTESGKIVEIQGTAEKVPFTQEEFFNLLSLAKKGVSKLISKQKEALEIK
ncbi:MAG: ribonuclease PH [Alphaproteobacteria bacterium]|nr:ribonuclease PH [Alphaproteobacteria bacterium]